VSNVWYAFDSPNSRVIFQSRRTRRHSLEIVADSRVAGAVVSGEQIGLGQKVRGISLEGIGSLVAGDDVGPAYEVYAARWPEVRDSVSVEQFLSPEGPGMYQVTLTRVVLFDEANFPDEPRQEFEIS